MPTAMHCLIPTLFALPLSASTSLWGGEGVTNTWTLPIQPEEPGGYAANPSTLKLPLRQDLTSLRLEQLASAMDDYEEQIALAAALKSLKALKAQ